MQNMPKHGICFVSSTKFLRDQINEDIKKVLDHILLDTEQIFQNTPKLVKQGLYKFSRIVSLPNIYDLKCPLVKITPTNKMFLECDFVKRQKGELEYLRRWFPNDAPVQGVLGDKVDVILYSHEQLEKEGTKIRNDWGIVAINVEMKKSSPIPPMTMINNQLGIKFGGNGEKINWKEYKKSVAFWKQYAIKKRS